MLRTRSVLAALLISASSVAILSSCSGKPENSPAIRKKFAEMKELQDTVVTMNTEVSALRAEINRLNEENSELRAFMPTIDGESATNKISTLEARLKELEGIARDSVVGQAAAPSVPSNKETASAPAPANKSNDLASATLAGSKKETKSATTSDKTVAVQQQATKPVQQSFKTMTAGSAKPPIQKTTTTTTTKKAASTTTSRGSYHQIKAGETVQSIAQQYNLPVNKLLQANRLPKGVRLANGQSLFIPAN